MCLIVKKGTRIKIAKEDITTYKEVDIYNNSNGIKIKSQTQRFDYKLGIIYSTKFRTIYNIKLGGNAFFADFISRRFYGSYLEKDLKSINIGFHSYSIPIENDICKRQPNVKCIIPKGTRYIEDETGLICSESIKLVEFL